MGPVRLCVMCWEGIALHLQVNSSYLLTLSTVTKFFGSICILLPRRNSELGLLPGGRKTEVNRGLAGGIFVIALKHQIYQCYLCAIKKYNTITKECRYHFGLSCKYEATESSCLA